MSITAEPSQTSPSRPVPPGHQPLDRQIPNQQTPNQQTPNRTALSRPSGSDHPTSLMEVTPLQLSAMFQPTRENPAPADPATLPCRRYDAELWFAETPADVELAKSLCLDCPVRQVCLDGALDRCEPWGVWGGQLLVQGAVVARKRPRGRPRKCEVAA
jgi:WhiB family transcriptional regulator, redox-sensing transcriptional regulator